jgi:asparagine synthase (glutamine-hydrolysing)
MHILGQSASARYIHWVAMFQQERRWNLLSPELRKQISEFPEDIIQRAMQVSNRGDATQAMHCDLQTYLPGDLLTKVDVTSMANGLECRSPFLDHRVVERSIALPFDTLTDRRLAKPMLTKTFPDLIPAHLRYRGKKGFCVPLDSWFRGSLREMARETLLSRNATSRPYFQTENVRELLDQHESGRWNHGDRIWSLLCFEQWHQTYIDAKASPGDYTPAMPTYAETERNFNGREVMAVPK